MSVTRFSIVCVLGLLAMNGCATSRPGVPAGHVDIIAHRGASAYAPENTLAAFRMAAEMEADWFELDCTLTRDGEVIVIHDNSLDRTTRADGKVQDFTLAELKRLEAGSWKDTQFDGEPLPTLGESLDFAKGTIGVYIEIKNSDDDKNLMARILEAATGQPTLSPELTRTMMTLIEDSGSKNLDLTRKVIAEVRARGMEDEVVIQSFSPIVCAVALVSAVDIRVEFLGGDKREDRTIWENFLRWGYLIDAAGFNVNHRSIDEGRLAAFHRGDKTVAVYTVNDESDMRRYINLGVNAIITDRPDVCLRILREMGKR